MIHFRSQENKQLIKDLEKANSLEGLIIKIFKGLKVI
jgi:hypothetical protein